MNILTAAAIGYILGSIPFGYLIARFAGAGDIRRAGSGNIGATNVSRVLGFGAGIATLLLDGGKGALAVWLAGRLGHGAAGPIIFAGLAAVVGHMYPAWLGFRGGRGVATAIGAFLVIGWMAVLADLALWLVAMLIWRYASLSSILWAAALPLAMYWLYAPGLHPPLEVSLGTVIVALLVIWRHRENLRRLVGGEEPRFTLHR
ncbi:MAG: glycerol-3-phosphate 1-O-acyltransferase PlsY [Acidobacteriota bacterium]|nr:glycerol-3-phosphate 1-O-acyltransferase PlsY [Acidobacteriota bacterium]